MNVIWITSDTYRRDAMGAYGNPIIHTPSLDALSASGTRFDRHYISAFPTMPTRADHATGRSTMSFMQWGPLDREVTTLAQLLAEAGLHTAAVVDTPFYQRNGMNYDRGFRTFFNIEGQMYGSDGRDIVSWWSTEADTHVARTMTRAGDWLENHYKEDFFLYVDTWDPHEPWNPPVERPLLAAATDARGGAAPGRGDRAAGVAGGRMSALPLRYGPPDPITELGSWEAGAAGGHRRRDRRG